MLTDGETKTRFGEQELRQHYDVAMALGDCYAEREEHSRAHECYQEAMELDPEEPGPHLGEGRIAMQTGQLDEGQKSFERARELEPRCANAFLGLGAVHMRREEYTEAHEMYVQGLEYDSENLEALEGLFEAGGQIGDYSKARHYLELYLEKHPGSTSALFRLGSIHANDGNLEHARIALSTAVTLAPDLSDAKSLLTEVEARLTDTPTPDPTE